jgi:serine/threonine protein kinase
LWQRCLAGEHASLLGGMARGSWYPAYAWLRRSGMAPEIAAETVKTAFTRWVTLDPPYPADPGAWHMRRWIRERLGALPSKGLEKVKTPIVQVDVAEGEKLYALEPDGRPDAIYERRWALGTLEAAIANIRKDYTNSGQKLLFEALMPFGLAAGEEIFEQAAKKTGVSLESARKVLGDFRARLRKALQTLVADIVADQGIVDDEVNALLNNYGSHYGTASTPLVKGPGTGKSPAAAEVPKASADAKEGAKKEGTDGLQWTPPTIAHVGRLFPSYDTFEILGFGGMGAVYRARQKSLDRHVAVKLLPLEVSGNKDFADRFVREARAMARMNHPNIVAVHDFGQTSEGHLFFTMEFVEGATLHQLIHQTGIKPRQAMHVVEQVCDALAYAHSKGVVHRDIKPANVLVGRDGVVKVADFGLARLNNPNAGPVPSSSQGRATGTGFILGTPDYMAPEQSHAMSVDHRADIYSLGVVLYEALVGEVPRGVFDPPSKRVRVDTRLDQIVFKAMQQQPERRFQTTSEMKAAVEAVRTGPVIAPVPVPVPRVTAASAPLASSVPVVRATPVAAGVRREKREKPPERSIFPAVMAVVALATVIGGIFFVRSRMKGTDNLTEAEKTALAHKGQPAPAKPPPPQPSIAKPEPIKTPVKPIVAPRLSASTEPWVNVMTNAELRGHAEANGSALRFRDTATVMLTPALKDCALRMIVALGDGTRGTGCEVQARKVPEKAYVLRLSGDRKMGEASLKLATSAATREFFQTPLETVPLAERPAEVELRVRGTTLTAKLNGTQIGQVNDTALSEGQLAVRLEEGTILHAIEWLDLTSSSTAATKPDPVKPPEPSTPPGPQAAAEVVKWLSENETTFTAQWKAEAVAPFDIAVAKLRAQYLATVESSFAAASKAAQLDAALAWRSEKTRLDSGQLPHESPDDPKDPNALKQLRENWRKNFAKLDAERYARAKAVHQRFDALLAAGQNGYTQRQRFEDAQLLRAKREEISRVWLVPAVDFSKPAPPKSSGANVPNAPKPQFAAGTLTGREAIEHLYQLYYDISYVDADEKKLRLTWNNRAEDVRGGRLEVVSLVTPGNRRADGGRITDEDFAKLAPMRKLAHFEAKGTEATGAGFGFLASSPELSEVFIEGPEISDAALEPLAGLAKLRAVSVGGGRKMEYARLGDLAALSELDSIGLYDVPTTPAGPYSTLARARKLRAVRLTRCTLGPEQAEILAALPLLDQITLSGTQGKALEKLEKAQNLTTLTLTNTPGAGAYLSFIGKLKKLRALTLDDGDLTGLGAITGAPALRSITLTGLRPGDDAGLKALANGLPKIESLTFATAEKDRAYTVAGIRELARLPKLTYLDWGKTPITPAIAAELAALPALEQLILTECAVDEKVVAQLAKSKTLTTLDLSRQKLPVSALDQLKTMRTLRELNINGSGLMLIDLATLRRTLSRCTIRD